LILLEGSYQRAVRGILITLEGIDGSGKSTAAGQISKKLEEYLPNKELILTSEPTGGAAGKLLRESLLGKVPEGDIDVSRTRRIEELLLFMADHADHLSRIVIPSLRRGAIVISDRYADSTAAYQGVTLRGMVPDPVAWIRGLYQPWNLVPDQTLLFLLDPSLAMARLSSRQGREKFESPEFLRLVDANFRRLAALEPMRFRVVDAGRGANEVVEEALSHLLPLLWGHLV
jgi:dTMP kinase